MVSNRRGIVLCVLYLFCLLTGVSPAAPASPDGSAGKLLSTPDGPGAWLLSPDGRLSRLELDAGRSVRHEIPGGPAGLTDIALSPDGKTLYSLAPAPERKTTALLALDSSHGQPLGRWDLRGDGRRLAISPDGSKACVALLRTGPGRRQAAAAEFWSLALLDLATGKVSSILAMELRPLSLVFSPGLTREARLYVAAPDRIATYTLGPLRSSWFYKSPGKNREIALRKDSTVVVALRGDSLAVFDPARRPREQGRVQLSEDDATMTVELPAPGVGLSLIEGRDGGAIAAVLHEDGLALTFTDLNGGTVVQTRSLSKSRDLIAPRVPGSEVVLASSRAVGSASEPFETVLAPPAPPPPAPAPAMPEAEAAAELPAQQPPVENPVLPGLPAPAQPPATPPEAAPEKSASPPIGSKPPDPAPQPVTEPKEPPPAVPEPIEGQMPEETPPPATPPEKPPEEPSIPEAETVAPPEPEKPSRQEIPPPRPSDERALAGRISGDRDSAREVLLFGPDNILKLHARAPVEQDGSFRLPLPPPGRYRLVVSGGPNTHLFTTPAFRTLVVDKEGQGLTAIDFEVRGKL